MSCHVSRLLVSCTYFLPPSSFLPVVPANHLPLTTYFYPPPNLHLPNILLCTAYQLRISFILPNPHLTACNLHEPITLGTSLGTRHLVTSLGKLIPCVPRISLAVDSRHVLARLNPPILIQPKSSMRLAKVILRAD